MHLRARFFLSVFMLAACGGNGNAGSGPIPQASAKPTSAPTLAPTSAPTATPTPQQTAPPSTAPTTITPTFNLKHAVGAVAKITLLSVNGNAVAAVSATAPISCNPACAGPSVPAGNDVFDIAVSDANGNVLTHAQASANVQASSAGPFDVTMLGVVASLNMTGFAKSYQADTGYAPTAITIAASDADGNFITGTYDTPITLAGMMPGIAYFVSDTKKNAQGQYADTVSQLNASSDPLYFYYNSQATAYTTLTATSGKAQASFAFNPQLNPIRIKDVNGGVIAGTGPVTIQAPATSVGFYVDENGFSDYGQQMVGVSNSCRGTLVAFQQPTPPAHAPQDPNLPDPYWGTYYLATQYNSAAVPTSCKLIVTDGLGQNQEVDIVWSPITN